MARNRSGGANHNCSVSGTIPAVAWAELEGGQLGRLPGLTAVLLRRFTGARARQGVWSVVAQDHGAAGLRGVGGARVQERRCGGVAGAEVSVRGLKAGGTVIAACGRGR